MPCKGWPSATASGGFGLDKALPVRSFATIGSTPSEKGTLPFILQTKVEE